jgi:uncharacterized protein YndB with AHSA1/START domain
MTNEVKSGRTLKMDVDVNAPIEAVWKALTEAEGIANWFAPIAKVSKPGLGGEVTVAWSDEMASTARVDAWELNKRVRWINEGMLGPGTVIAMDFHLEADGGKTRVRLVQSGFGESEGWDDFFEGTETGWAYFLYNLRLYVERHLGRNRQMISERLEVRTPRDTAWRHIVSAATGVSPDRAGAIKPGDRAQFELDGTHSARAVVELAIAERALALRLPDLEDSVLFIELEGGRESFHVGWWLSVYDAGHAKELAAPAKQAFRRIHESLPTT